MEGSETFVVDTLCLCSGSLMRAVWFIPNISHSNSGGVVVSAIDEAIEFTFVEGRVISWDGFMGGWGGVEQGCIVEARHNVCVED